MKLIKLLNEIQFYMYQTLVYVEFEDSTNITDVAQLYGDLVIQKMII